MECNVQPNVLMTSLIISNPYVTEYYKVLFDKCDKNNDGYISIKELKKFIENQEDHHVPDQVIIAIHSNFDRNRDKLLDFDEFLEMINSPIFAKTFQRLRSRYLKFVVITPSVPQRIRLHNTLTSTGLYEEELTCKKTTIGMVTLSVFQILLYYVNIWLKYGNDKGPIEKALGFSQRRKYEIWRYITHIFVHGDAMHVYPNVIIQILIGVPLEMVHSWRVLVIYVAGALGGCLAHSVIVPQADLVGGSGGFYAFYTAHIATVIMNWREMSHPIANLILFGTMTIFDPIYNYVIQKDMDSVSYITHLGGSVVGLLLGVNILKNLKVTAKEGIVRYICLIAYAIFMIIFVILDIIKSSNTLSIFLFHSRSFRISLFISGAQIRKDVSHLRNRP